MIMKVWRDSNGELINIGEWKSLEGDNPLPDGAYEEESEVVEGYDGGLYLSDDPRN